MKEHTRHLEAYLAFLHEGLVVLCPAACCWFVLDSSPVYVEFLFKKIAMREICFRTLLFSVVRIIPSMSLINVTLICHQCYMSGSVVKGHIPSHLRLNDYSYTHTYVRVCVCICIYSGNAEFRFTFDSFKVVGVCEILSFAEPCF